MQNLKKASCAFLSTCCFLLLGSALVCQGQNMDWQENYDYAFPTEDGCFKVRRSNDTYTFVDSTGQLAENWQWYASIGNFWQGVAPFQDEGKWGLIRPSGEIVLPALYDEVKPTLGKNYWFSKQHKWGLVDATSGEVILPAEETQALYWYEGVFVVYRNGSAWLLGEDGQWLTQEGYDWIMGYHFPVTYFLSGRDGKTGILGHRGKEIVPPVLDNDLDGTIHLYDQGRFWVRQNHRWGLVDTTGRWLISPRFDQVRSPAGDAGAWVSNAPGYWGFVDILGQFLLEPQKIDEPTYPGYQFRDDGVLVRRDSLWGVLAEHGDWHLPPKYQEIVPLGQVFWGRTGSGWEMIDYEGKKRIPDAFDHLGEFNYQGVVWAEKAGSWQLFNDQGQRVFPDVETLRPDTYQKFIYARRDGRWGLFSPTRGWINEAIYEAIPDEEDNPIPLAIPMKLDKDGRPGSPQYPNRAFWFKQEDKWLLTDTTGLIFSGVEPEGPLPVQLLGAERFALAHATNELSKQGWKLYDRSSGRQISDQSFDEIVYRAPGVIGVRRGGLWGRIDENGQIIFPIIMEYDRYRGLIDGRSAIGVYGEEFWVEKDGTLGRQR